MVHNEDEPTGGVMTAPTITEVDLPDDVPVPDPEPGETGKKTGKKIRFTGIMTLLDKVTGDRRIMYKNDEIRIAPLPMPFMWQEKSGEGHDDSVIVGRINSVWVEGGDLHFDGVFNSKYPEAVRVAEMVKDGFHRWVSIDADDAYQEEADADDGLPVRLVKTWRARGATLVNISAYADAAIRILDDEDEPVDPGTPEDETLSAKKVSEVPVVEAEIRTPTLIASLVAAGAPLAPPREWFKDPKLTKPTPLTVTEEGRVFGHIADWKRPHIGFNGREVFPPRSASSYKFFHTGAIRTAEGDVLPVGSIFVGTAHAGTELSSVEAMYHYSHSGSACIAAQVGEDAHGIWVAGTLTAEATPEKVAAILRCPPSGDWRPIAGNLELVCALSVNTPGFPTPRPMMRVGEDNRIYSLVAAGALAPEDPMTEERVREIVESVIQEHLDKMDKPAEEPQVANPDEEYSGEDDVNFKEGGEDPALVQVDREQRLAALQERRRGIRAAELRQRIGA